jgi:hypothetical protein
VSEWSAAIRDHAAGSMKTSGTACLSRKRSRIRKYRVSDANRRASAPATTTTSEAAIHNGENTHHHDQSVTPASLSAMKTPISGYSSQPWIVTGDSRPERALILRA